MCVICVKRKGVRMPNESEIKAMWDRNPDGAGYMFAREGDLIIRKGFMTIESLKASLKADKVTARDPLVMHFRISTQGGINPEMCHPFPVTTDYNDLRALESHPSIGLAHNGIIQRCSSPKASNSDTAIFVAEFASQLLRTEDDIRNQAICTAIQTLAPANKFAFMNSKGVITMLGDFSEHEGLMYSNLYHTSDYLQWIGRFTEHDVKSWSKADRKEDSRGKNYTDKRKN